MKKEISELLAFIKDKNCLLAITGAGCSTDSGISDYRDSRGLWKKPPPIQYQDFLRSENARKRYWLRSQLGYPSFRDASPNKAHQSLVRLESFGIVHGLITQNVDRLHQKAGHREVIDLHGRLDEVVCLECNKVSSRNEVQVWLESENPFVNHLDFELRPDGDASVEVRDLSAFVVPKCSDCHGMIRPNVVFFGGSVPKQTAEDCQKLVDGCDGLLIVGTSLMAFSAYRLVRSAYQNGLQIASLNQGTTRADEMISCNIVENCSFALTNLVEVYERSIKSGG